MNFSEVAFFGDSWVEGAELKTNQDNFVKILGAKNYGRQGSSIPGLLQIFHDCKEKNFKVAIFCLGEPSRIIYYSDKDFYLDSNAGYGKKGHPLHDTHQKLMAMSTDYDQDIKVSQSVYVLYKWCLDLNITPYFVNMY